MRITLKKNPKGLWFYQIALKDMQKPVESVARWNSQQLAERACKKFLQGLKEDIILCVYLDDGYSEKREIHFQDGQDDGRHD